jgi:3-methyladenine DNA glycosylase/8-oxoguanine DNA glycosylase
VAASFIVPTPDDFDFAAVVASHGWYQLAPFRFDVNEGRLEGVARGVAARPVAFSAGPAETGDLRVMTARPLGPRVRERLAATVERIFALDVDLRPLHRRCRREPQLRWIARRKLGRFLRGEDLFEDLVKTLLTTNCTWKQTVGAVDRLVTGLGRRGGARGPAAFPEAGAVAAAGAARLRSEFRLGYRAESLMELAERAAARGPEEWLRGADGQETFRRLRSLRGFGEYAASSMLMLLGHHDRLVIDSWALARARAEKLDGAEASSAEVRALYEGFGEHRGVIAWFDLNRAYFRRFPPDWLRPRRGRGASRP